MKNKRIVHVSNIMSKRHVNIMSKRFFFKYRKNWKRAGQILEDHLLEMI